METKEVFQEIKDVTTESQSGERVETKFCKKCGRVLPLSAFSKNRINKDGLQMYCKECQSVMNKRRNDEKRALVHASEKNLVEDIDNKPLLKVYANPELARFTPRQLMEELKARGFVWNYMLEPQRRISYSKI